MSITFDTSAAPALFIDLDPAQTRYSAREIYSRWKDWVWAGHAGWPPAFRTVGGDVTGEGEYAPRFFFIRNDLGWTIRKPNGNGEYLIDGNLIGENTSLASLSDPAGVFAPTVRLQMTQVSGINTRSFWETIIADFDQGTAGFIIARLLRLAEADEELTPSHARLRDKDTGEVLLEKDVSGGDVVSVNLSTLAP